MDSKDNFLKKFQEFIDIVDNEYLIGISNKGIVNRAGKDLDKTSNIQYEVKDGEIEFRLDDINCSVTYEINTYKCSCPSRSICKHVIMCYLYLIENKDKIFVFNLESESIKKIGYENEKESDETAKENRNDLNNKAALINLENINNLKYIEENTDILKKIEEVNDNLNEERFIKLKEFSIDSIKKAIGERNFERIIKRIEFGINVNITEGPIIIVDFNKEAIVVKLLDNMENSICTCKSRELCIHKGEALILYKLQKGYVTFNQLKDYINVIQYLEKENIQKASERIKKCIEDILISGLSRIPLTILDRLNNMAVICHNYDLPNFERNLRGIREEISLYLNKNASFKKERLLNKLTSLYTKAIALENTKDLDKLTLLAGEFKSSYYEVPPLELHGLGAEAWTSKSGYEGTTFYFFESTKKQIFTYTNAIPTYYDNSNKINRNLNSSAPWELNCSIQKLSFIHFNLVYGKINSQNRISSSNESKGTVIEKNKLNEIELKEFTYDNWRSLTEKVFLNEHMKNSNLVFLNIESFGESIFDEILQILKVPIYDKLKNIIEIRVDFSVDTKNMIHKIERIAKKGGSALFFGRVYISLGKVLFYPITFYSSDGKGENLKF